jgi:perosamine synthetase
MIPVNRPLISEEDRDAVISALDATYISGETPPVQLMEKLLAESTDTAESVAFSTGTAAIDILIESLEVEPGDNCVLPSFTIISTVSNLLRKGAKVELIDSDPITWSIDSEKAAHAIKGSTKLVMPVHIYGLPTDMNPILEAAEPRDCLVVEDSAEALGVSYNGKPCGSLGDAAVFSFYANKIVTGGEGGAITTNDRALADKLRSLRNLAHSEQRFVHNSLGWNARISGLGAALIASQIQRLPSLIERKIQIANIYLEGLQGHPYFDLMTPKVKYATNTYWVVPLLLKTGSPYSAVSLQSTLKKFGVDSRRFFCPIHLQPFAKKFDLVFDSKMTVADNLWENGLYLPSGLGITQQEIEKVIEVLWEIAK